MILPLKNKVYNRTLTDGALRLLFFLLLMLPVTFSGAVSTFAEADSLRREAFVQLARGDIDKAHDGLLRAIDLFKQCDNQETVISLCYYQLSVSYFNQRDLSALQDIIGKMQALAQAHPDNIYILYDYFSVQACYESACNEDEPSDSLRDQMMSHMKKALHYQEQMKPKDWTEKMLNPVFNYMNVATLYDLAYDPPLTDSTRHYVEKARAANRLEWARPIDHLEADISICDMQAWLYYYDKHFEQAEREMVKVLTMIDSIESLKGNAVLTQRGDAYEFLSMLYEETGRPSQALEYQRLLNENHRQRFSVEKNQALHEVEARYEVEKKEEAISHLNAQNRILLLMLLTIGVALLLALALWFYRHRLREQRLYTEALQADAEQQAEHTSLTLLADQLDITNVNLEEALSLMRRSEKPLTVVDQKYILCFLAGESVKRIAARFNVEPASVYTVRYRLKKKFPVGQDLPF